MKVKLHSQILSISIGYNPRRQTSTTERYKSWSQDMTSVSIAEVNMLKNSSAVAVSVPINLSIKLAFISVNGPRETYFVDRLRISSRNSVFLAVGNARITIIV